MPPARPQAVSLGERNAHVRQGKGPSVGSIVVQRIRVSRRQSLGPDRSAVAAVAMIVGVALVLTACGSSVRTASSGSERKASRLHGTLTVAAAASLTGVFGELGRSFEDRHPGAHVAFAFGSSGVLETQIAQGAPADVFASADAAVMEQAERAGVVDGAPTVFARNALELVVQPGNPLGIRTLADLRRAKVVAMCATRAPCGASAAKILDRVGVELPSSMVTRGQDVKATLAQVTVGDADAAIVYVTDARTVGAKGKAVKIPAAQDLITDYPIAVVKGSKHLALAEAWIAFVEGPVGQASLHAAGFQSSS